MKLLLYCTKSKPYLNYEIDINKRNYFTCIKYKDNFNANGKIVGECDYEVERIINAKVEKDADNWYSCINLTGNDLLEKSCLTIEQLDEYLKGKWGYAIHIKNLVIYDEPKELNDYDKYEYEVFSGNGGCLGTEWKPIEKAPQNMMYVEDNGVKKILISIRPEWLCLILNRIKDVEVRRVVLKEMINND